MSIRLLTMVWFVVVGGCDYSKTVRVDNDIPDGGFDGDGGMSDGSVLCVDTHDTGFAVPPTCDDTDLLLDKQLLEISNEYPIYFQNGSFHIGYWRFQEDPDPDVGEFLSTILIGGIRLVSRFWEQTEQIGWMEHPLVCAKIDGVAYAFKFETMIENLTKDDVDMYARWCKKIPASFYCPSGYCP